MECLRWQDCAVLRGQQHGCRRQNCATTPQKYQWRVTWLLEKTDFAFLHSLNAFNFKGRVHNLTLSASCPGCRRSSTKNFIVFVARNSCRPELVQRATLEFHLPESLSAALDGCSLAQCCSSCNYGVLQLQLLSDTAYHQRGSKVGSPRASCSCAGSSVVTFTVL